MRTLVATCLAVAILALVPCVVYADTWAAFASNGMTKSYGYSWGHPSRDAARAGALMACRRYPKGENCTFGTDGQARTRCISIAKDSNHSWGHVGYADSRAEAQRAALNNCRRSWKPGVCRLSSSACAGEEAERH